MTILFTSKEHATTISGVEVTAVVEYKERAPSETGLSISGQYFAAVVRSGPSSYHWTKGSEEKAWYCDAIFRKGLPEFVHGEGSRCCMKKVCSEGPVFDLLEAAAKEAASMHYGKGPQ
jgi:hypothetical protein